MISNVALAKMITNLAKANLYLHFITPAKAGANSKMRRAFVPIIFFYTITILNIYILKPVGYLHINYQTYKVFKTLQEA
jgi:hypothetical protein